MSEIAVLSPSPASETPRRLFFDVSVLKLVVMSVVTFGLYEVYWFYRNWQLAKERGDSVRPVPRAIFAVLFAYGLFQRVRSAGRSVSLNVAANASGLAWLYFFLVMTWRLPDPGWLLSFGSVLPLAVIQKDVVKIHVARGLDPNINDRFTWKNILGIVAGAALILVVLAGLFFPEPAT